jgi:hypothetical protein
LPKVDHFGEVEEGSGYGRDRDAGSFGPNSLVEAPAMQADAVASRSKLAAAGSGHVDNGALLAGETPKRCGASMA